jgi:glucose-6-phosphate dehydrogenase assembly protein OpcA
MASSVAAAGADRSMASSPGRIERDLAALWSEMGSVSPVTRAVMANLVIVCQTDANPAHFTATMRRLQVNDVTRRHPCRVIVLQQTAAEAPRPGVDAVEVGVHTFGPPQARCGVEYIAVRSGCSGASLPSIVRALALGDVPTSLWWVDDPCDAAPFAELVAMSRQVLYDSRTWRDVRTGALALASILAHPHPPDLADLNWRRLLSLRRALVTTIQTAAASDRTSTIAVHYRPGEAALAWLLVGWLSARGAVPDPGLLDVREGAGEDILRIVLPDASIALAMDAVRVSAEGAAVPLTAAVPQESAFDAIAAELRSLRHDDCLHDAIVALAHLPSELFSR